MDKNIYTSKTNLLELLGIRENFLYVDFDKRYREKMIPKKTGDLRLIRPPVYGLKKVQRKILDFILSKSSQLDCVYGLSKNRTVLHNAKAHDIHSQGQLITLDIKDFFPNITRKMIFRVFTRLGFTRENAAILTKICTVNYCLPQGSPTSPFLSSLICADLDQEIYTYCKRRKLLYTRYFDDICVSGLNLKEDAMADIERIITKHGFTCNDKRKFFDTNEQKVINGIVLGNVMTVTEKYKDEIRKSYFYMITNNNQASIKSFMGKIGFYRFINRKEANDFLNQLKT